MSCEQLLILGSSLTALAVARVASRSGLDVSILDDRRGPASETRKARFRLLSSSDPEGLRAELGTLVGSGSAALLADSDRWLRFLAKAHGELSRSGITVLHPRPEVIETCLDKSEFLRWCEKNDVPAPRLYEVGADTRVDELDFPLLIRPAATLHSVPTSLPKARHLTTPAELEQLLEAFAAAGVVPTVSRSLVTPTLIQLSVGAARNARGDVRTFLAEKVRPPADRCAGGTFVRPIALNGVEQLAVDVLDRLDYFGIAEVEILHDRATGQSSVVEVNARPWLQFGLSFACGEDLLRHALDLPSEPSGRRGKHAWLDFRGDFRQCFGRPDGMHARGEITLRAYLRSLAEADVYPLWDVTDIGPLVRSAAGTFRRVLRRLMQRRRAGEPAPSLRSDATGS